MKRMRSSLTMILRARSSMGDRGIVGPGACTGTPHQLGEALPGRLVASNSCRAAARVGSVRHSSRRHMSAEAAPLRWPPAAEGQEV